jgi:prevent-host-death family protein
MRKTSIRELHIHTSQLVREAAEGGVIVIERRGEPVAELRPLSAKPKLSAARKAKIFAEMREFWESMPPVSDSTALVSEERDR